MLDRLTITYANVLALRLCELANLVTHFCLPSSDRRYITLTVRLIPVSRRTISDGIFPKAPSAN
ncbi:MULTISPECIES: hypothetical protein [unclassified Microcoleus]|uniref:hypothetical protein n=1 Tax=unclassified Microcoleus TaxID=2642155 RepID=UPI002FD3D23D